MAEALINHLGGDAWQAHSAGSRPAGFVHAGALATLRRHGIATGSPKSQSWDDFANTPFDYVVTVCDSAAAETCPAFPGNFRRLHWSTPDPAAATGDDAVLERAFEQAFSMLKARIENELLNDEGARP